MTITRESNFILSLDKVFFQLDVQDNGEFEYGDWTKGLAESRTLLESCDGRGQFTWTAPEAEDKEKFPAKVREVWYAGEVPNASVSGGLEGRTHHLSYEEYVTEGKPLTIPASERVVLGKDE